MLQYMVGSERHRRVLSRDEARGQGKAPLKNQVAVFWVKDALPENAGGEKITIDDLEAVFAVPLGQDAGSSSPVPLADPAHVKALYDLPWTHRGSGLRLDQNRFYLAVLSPNKARLVVRAWIDETLSLVCGRLQAFDSARTIVHPDGLILERITIPEMLGAQRPWKSTSSAPDANRVRGLIRTAYAGAPVPAGLLERAVLRFRIPDRAQKKTEEEELSRRRMALAATIKLALTFGTKEADTLQTLDRERRVAPYLCGRLLAVLEEAQGRSSHWKVNTTLVDRFYGSASTAPASVFGLLVKRATQDHFPKVRRERRGHGRLSEEIEDVMRAIDQAGGFPNTLTMHDQGEFALGFYHQRADFRAQRPKPDAGPATNTTPLGQEEPKQ
jgi:CRISPR-associated protein Csd1